MKYFDGLVGLVFQICIKDAYLESVETDGVMDLERKSLGESRQKHVELVPE